MSLLPSDEIIQVAHRLSIDVRVIDPTRADEVRSQLLKSFVPDWQDWPTWIWEHLSESHSTHAPDGWKWIGEYFGACRCLLGFNPQDDSKMILVKSGSDLTKLLSETSGYEFHVTDPETSCLILYNHHDFLIACGQAMPWLRSRSIP